MDIYGLDEKDVHLLLKLVGDEIVAPQGNYSLTGNTPERRERLKKLKEQFQSLLLHQNQGR